MRLLQLLIIQPVYVGADHFPITSEEDNRVRVDVLLELRLQHPLQLLFIDIIFLRNGLTVLSKDNLLLWSLGEDKEDVLGLLVLSRIAIKDIASVLTVILIKSPSHSLVHKVVWVSLTLCPLALLSVNLQLLLYLNFLPVRIWFSLNIILFLLLFTFFPILFLTICSPILCLIQLSRWLIFTWEFLTIINSLLPCSSLFLFFFLMDWLLFLI